MVNAVIHIKCFVSGIVFIHVHLSITGTSFYEPREFLTWGGVDELVYYWEWVCVLKAHLIQVSKVATHPSFSGCFFEQTSVRTPSLESDFS